MMNSPENKPSVTLEDLLRLKRAERPSPEFWAKFESQLRAKQLAAIVEKQPWWRSLSLAGLVRHRVLLGSTALLAISFVSIREYRAVPAHPKSGEAVREVALTGSSTSLAPAEAVVLAETANVVAPPAVEAAPVRLDSNAVARVAAPENSVEASVYAGAPVESQAVAARADDAPQAAQWLVAVDRPDPDRLSPTARSIADNLAAAKEAHPELTNRFFGVSGFEKRVMPSSRQTVDPLAQMRSPSETHLRVLASSVRSSSSVALGRDSERITRRISDERLTEEAISRFGARGNELSVKF